MQQATIDKVNKLTGAHQVRCLTLATLLQLTSHRTPSPQNGMEIFPVWATAVVSPSHSIPLSHNQAD